MNIYKINFEIRVNGEKIALTRYARAKNIYAAKALIFAHYNEQCFFCIFLDNQEITSEHFPVDFSY